MPQSPTSDSPVAHLRERPRASVLIIGGGINGISTFRDLSLQGVDVTLIDRGDFCSGASSASSHMIHGGIRYLENGEFRLVKESVAERNALLQIAPHFVKPLKTTVPIFSTFSGILSAPQRFFSHRSRNRQERGAILIKIGLALYDSFSRGGSAVSRHEFVGRTSTLSQLPLLNSNVKYTASYYDASMHDPERLALDVLRDGLEANPRARAVNYVEAIGIEEGNVLLLDHRTGSTIKFTADVVVNASGPFTDITNAALGERTTYMGGTKGSHIVVDNPELLAATDGREIFFEHSDGRIVLIYPLKGRVMIGTTDLNADPADPTVCTDSEIDYFIDLVAYVFPTISVDQSQIIYRFSGIRPLPSHDDQEPGFVSRDYRIIPSEISGVKTLSLVGGKWTTFRALGEHLSNKVLSEIGKSRTVDTADLPIGGGAGYPSSAAQREVWMSAYADGISRERANQLLERYGTYAERIIDEISEVGDDRLDSADSYGVAELRYLASNEHVEHLSDVIQRRTSLAFTGQTSRKVLAEVAKVIAPVLGWDEDRIESEVCDLGLTLRNVHGVVDLSAMPDREVVR